MTNILQILISALLLLFSLWLLFKISLNLWSFISPPKEIVILPFEGGDKQKATAQAILSAKLRGLQNRSKEAPTGYGLFSLPLLESPLVPAQTPTNAFTVLDSFEVKIREVNLSSVIKAFDAALSPARYELQGTVSELPGSVFVTCKLVLRGTVKASWEAEEKTSPTDDMLSKALDQILYQMIYDFIKQPRLAAFRVQWGGKLAFKDWKGLQSYMTGLSAFRSYQVGLDPNDLQVAYKAFDQLASNEPGEPLGLYFRGLVLSEMRKEAEAVADFEKLQRLLRRMPDDDRCKRMLREARLNEATSRLKLYRMDAGIAAAKTLTDLISEIRQDLAPQTELQHEMDAAKALGEAKRVLKEKGAALKRAEEVEADSTEPARLAAGAATQKARELLQIARNEEKQAAETLQAARVTIARAQPYLTKLLVLCHAQLGYTHATILSFLHDLGEPNRAKVTEQVGAMEDNLERADSWYRAVPEKEWGTEREQRDVQFRILNARGYGRYRQAYFLALDAPKGHEGETYRDNCAKAIDDLEDAKTARPNHYEVLQNLGMIYDDERFDPAGDYLDQAQELFELTRQFVPEDYYQYEQLALIHLRKAKLLPASQRKAEIEAGREDASLALKKRKPLVSASALDHLAQLAGVAWDSKTDGPEAAEAVRAFKEAAPRCLTQPAFREEYLKLLKALDPLRQQSARGLKEIVECAFDLGGKPGTIPQSNDLKSFADQLIQQSEKLIKAAEKLPDSPENKAPIQDAKDLKEALDKLRSAVAP